jgi:hypothetical protein
MAFGEKRPNHHPKKNHPLSGGFFIIFLQKVGLFGFFGETRAGEIFGDARFFELQLASHGF